MYVGAEEAAAKTPGAGLGTFLLKAGQAWFNYDVAKSQAEAGSVLQAQGLTSAQAATAVGRPTVPGLLQNPLVMGGLAMLAGVVVYKTFIAKK